MELNLARDVKNNQKGFHRYAGQKRKYKDSVLPLINEKGELASTDTKKSGILNNSQWYLKSHGSQVNSLLTRKKAMSHSFLRRVERMTGSYVKAQAKQGGYLRLH